MHRGSRVALDLGELSIGDGQRIVLMGIELRKLVDTVEDLSHEFLRYTLGVIPILPPKAPTTAVLRSAIYESSASRTMRSAFGLFDQPPIDDL